MAVDEHGEPAEPGTPPAVVFRNGVTTNVSTVFDDRTPRIERPDPECPAEVSLTDASAREAAQARPTAG